MRRFIHRLQTDDGITLIELMISTFISAITLAVLLSWITVMDRMEGFQQEDFDALNELRFAKAEMVKELRYADSVISLTSDTIVVWVDHDVDGVIDGVGTGETVAWQILGGTLVRMEDSDSTTLVTKVEHLVGADSSFAITGDLVDVVLVADIDSAGGPSARTIETQVKVRNA